MGLSSKSSHYESSKTIILLQWQSFAKEYPPRLQFWTLDCPNSNQANKALPVPVAVTNRIPPTTLADGVQLPPLLEYSGPLSSILMNTLTVDKNVNIEFTRWGPGIHVAQTQTFETLFTGSSLGLSDATHLSPVAMRPETSRNYGQHSSALLAAIAVDNDDGTVSIKYRSQTHGRNTLALPTRYDLDKDQEKTLRTAMSPKVLNIGTWPSQKSNIPVHSFIVGSSLKYLVLMTLSQNQNQTKNLLSLHMMDERTFMAEAASTREHNEDQGFRWQSQTFELPKHVTNVTPIVLDVNLEQYLYVFYFDNGALCYARIRYAGSGSFMGFVDKMECFPTVTEEQRTARVVARTPAFESSVAPRSRWSLSSRFLNPSEFEPEQKEEQKGEPIASQIIKEERGDESLPLAAENCQPYLVIVKGSIWIFYQGADGDAKYVCRKFPTNNADIHDSWEAASWATSLAGGEHNVQIPSHFIPVVVPREFMNMK